LSVGSYHNRSTCMAACGGSVEDLKRWVQANVSGQFNICLADDVIGDPFPLSISAEQNLTIRCIKASGLCQWPGTFDVSSLANLKLSRLSFSGLKGPVLRVNGGKLDVDKCTFTRNTMQGQVVAACVATAIVHRVLVFNQRMVVQNVTFAGGCSNRGAEWSWTSNQLYIYWQLGRIRWRNDVVARGRIYVR
jgi:hypothetical protein